MRNARRRTVLLLPFVLSWPWASNSWAFNGKDVSARGIGGELNVPDHTACVDGLPTSAERRS